MRLFVASIDYSVDESQLYAAFLRYRLSWAKIVRDPTGKSKGYGFVEIYDTALGALAISELDGSFLAGRRIAVTEAGDNRGARR